MKKRKMSNRDKGKILIVAAIIGTAILLFVLFIIIIGSVFSPVFSKNSMDRFINVCIQNGVPETILTIAAVVGGFIFLIAFVNQILPMLCFFIGKPLAYFKIWCICLKKRYSCRFRRPIFASLSGVGERSDVEIKTEDKTLHIHFIDIPFPFLRMFLLVNDREYRMHRSVPGKLRGFGGFIRPSEHEMDPQNYTIYTIPEFSKNETESHYLVISPSYANSFFISQNLMLSVTGECASGNVTVCKMKVLKKRLKNKLYTPTK